MSYNGVGLQTPRGSGTSGHVQKSTATRQTEGSRERRQRQAQELRRKAVKAKAAEARTGARAEIKTHMQRRQVEVACAELRDELEEEGVKEDIIVEKVQLLRSRLMSDEPEETSAESKETTTEKEGRRGSTDDQKPAKGPEPAKTLISYNYVPRYN